MQPATVTTTQVDVAHLHGEAYEIRVRGHRVRVDRHGYGREGLAVHCGYTMATDRPARVVEVRIALQVPDALPAERYPALVAVASHCTVHNSLTTAPGIIITVG